MTDAQGETHEIRRSLLRHHNKHNVATSHVTENRIHDRHTMQRFTTSTHIKKTGAIKYFTTLIGARVGPNKTAFVSSFGVPGHREKVRLMALVVVEKQDRLSHVNDRERKE